MRTIQVTNKTKNGLLKYADGDESFDSIINRLLDEVEDELKNREEISGYANIGVTDTTLERLQSLKMPYHDSYTKLLTDALSYVK